MRRATSIFVWTLLFTAATPAIARLPARAQTGRVVDRIVARVESDIILLSQVRELGAFQQLIEGRAESDDRLLAEVIEQWIVQTEATESRFPQPAQSEVDRELARLAAQFPGPDAYAARLRELGLSAAQARELLKRQIYVERYLDYKFRPLMQIQSADIESYYQKELLPELAKKNQLDSGGLQVPARPAGGEPALAPRLADVEGEIRELLTPRGITDLATKWLDETKARLKIEVTSPEAKP
jgi:parvulin-like peptidyl-prolyl isomerase